MFKSADPTKRIPTYLQPHTKENAIWQLKLLPFLFALVMLHGWWDDRQYEKRQNKKHQKS